MGVFRVLGVIVVAVLAIGLAGAIFQTGYLAGIAADGGVAPVVVGPGYGWGWGWGPGGGIVGILGFLFFLVIVIAVVRVVSFGGRGGWGHGGWGRGGWAAGPRDHHGDLGPWEDRARAAHEAWHRRDTAAEGRSSGGADPGAPTSGGGPA